MSAKASDTNRRETSSRADGSPRAYVSNILSKQIILIVLYLNGNINITSYVAYSSGSMTTRHCTAISPTHQQLTMSLLPLVTPEALVNYRKYSCSPPNFWESPPYVNVPRPM